MITFESIRDLERAERESKKLQRIPDGFVAEIQDYLATKEKLASPEDVMELQAVKGTVARLLEMRERKVVDGAIITARTGLPPENLTAGEAELFWAIVERLKRFREDFFGKASSATAQVGHSEVVCRRAWRVVKAVDFVGPDLKEYKLKVGEEVELPDEVAAILKKDGAIVEAR
ncbi:MAG: hypothetical protein QW548_00435 [Candidatus Aenigmatarchaeota archaeon]